jgi:hypothetical protein
MLTPLHPERTVLMDPGTMAALAAAGTAAASAAPSLGTVATIASAGLTAAGTMAAMSASKKSAQAQYGIAGQQDEAAKAQYAATFGIDRAADQQVTAARTERQAADAVFAAQARAYQRDLQATQLAREAAKGELTIGQAKERAAAFRADQLLENANAERAAGATEAQDIEKQKALAQSTLLARVAASGAGANDPTIQRLRQDIEATGEHQALMKLYSGDMAARATTMQSLAERITGNAEMAQAIGQYSGREAGLAGDVAQAQARLDMARAGLTVSDATQARALAQAQITRTQAEAARADALRSSTAAAATRAGAQNATRQSTVLGLQGLSSLFDTFGKSKLGSRTLQDTFNL